MINSYRLFYKFLQETLILPLYFTIGKTFNDPRQTANKIKTGLIVIVVVFSVSTFLLYISMPWLVIIMAQKTDLHEHSISYVR